MKQLKFIIIFLIVFTLACSDSKDSDPQVSEKNEDAKKQIDEALAELSKDAELSEFTAALATIDVPTLEGKSFTLLAYKNKTEEDNKKASVARAASTPSVDANVLRHMVSGSYTLEQLKKEKKLVALSKDTLYIDSSNDELKVNGVKLGKSVVVDNSIIFVMDSIIPVIEPPVIIEQEKYELTIYNINSKWLPEQEIHEGTAGGVSVNIYEMQDTITHIKTVVADANGKVNFTHNIDAILLYSISNEDSHSTFDGYVVTGLFTTQAEVEDVQYPYYQSFKKEVGGLKVEDINADGIITKEDKVEYAPLSTKTTEVYLVPESFKVNNDIEDINLDDTYDAYDMLEETYYRIDNIYSTLTKRKVINVRDSTLTAYWRESYNVIGYINSFLKKETDKETFSELKEMRASIYTTLTTLFGRVPIQIQYPLEPKLPQNSQEEIQDFVLDNLNETLVNATGFAKSKLYLKKALLLRDKKNYNGSFLTLKDAIGADTLSYNPSQTEKILYLLASEMAIEASGGGNLIEAAGYVNILYNAQGIIVPLPNGASEKDILAVVKRDIKRLDSGIKFMNVKQWEDMAEWGNYALLPIPSEAITQNEKLEQNAGW